MLTRLFITAVTIALFPQVAAARDECKDVLINKVMDITDLKQTREITLAVLARTSTSKSDAQSVQTGAKFPIEGIPVEGQGNWARSQKSEMSKSLDLDLAVRESGSLLMLSGQAKIVSAWKDCMLQKGGGLGTYFEPIGDGARQVFFHLEYMQDSLKKGKQQLPLTLMNDVFLDANVKALAGEECFKKGFVMKPGEECTVQMVVPSAWTVVPIVMSFSSSEDGSKSSISDVLLPRVSPVVQTVAVSLSIPEIYSVGGVASSPTKCLDAPQSYSFVAGPKIIPNARGAAATANSCDASYTFNETQTRVCIDARIARTPRAPADYYCSWQIEAVAATIAMFPPKP
ncbi:hypothetical protein AB8B21_18255 [Tardiphaga sp. 866_E4_N2_1]|uniref:hypothetical protein n=1 Tax=unclassified Tardiphaga TaxID=2631404 RepID=UPI003F20D90E